MDIALQLGLGSSGLVDFPDHRPPTGKTPDIGGETPVECPPCGFPDPLCFLPQLLALGQGLLCLASEHGCLTPGIQDALQVLVSLEYAFVQLDPRLVQMQYLNLNRI